MWSNRSGAMRRKGGSYIQYGIPPEGGGSDLIGIGANGLWIAVELKTKDDIITRKQVDFLVSVQIRDGFAAIVAENEKDEKGFSVIMIQDAHFTKSGKVKLPQ